MKNYKKRELVTVQQLAQELSVHHQTVRRWYHNGEIINYGKGRILKFDLNEILRLS